jgi:hypothetical protein
LTALRAIKFSEGIKEDRCVKIKPFAASAYLAQRIHLIVFSVFHSSYAFVCVGAEVLDVEELLLVSAPRALKCLDYVLNRGVVHSFVVRDPHFVFFQHLVQVDEVNPITMA